MLSVKKVILQNFKAIKSARPQAIFRRFIGIESFSLLIYKAGSK